MNLSFRNLEIKQQLSHFNLQSINKKSDVQFTNEWFWIDLLNYSHKQIRKEILKPLKKKSSILNIVYISDITYYLF